VTFADCGVSQESMFHVIAVFLSVPAATVTAERKRLCKNGKDNVNAANFITGLFEDLFTCEQKLLLNFCFVQLMYFEI